MRLPLDSVPIDGAGTAPELDTAAEGTSDAFE